MTRLHLLTTAASVLASTLLAAAVPAAAASAPAGGAAVPASSEVTSVGDWGKLGLQTEWMDKASKPGDDFFRYVNGTWVDRFEIPADKVAWGSFYQLDALSDARLDGILKELVAAQSAGSKPAAGSDAARIVASYSAFMDEAGIEAAGLAPARPWLDRIAAAKSADDLLALFAAPGLPSPIDLGVDADSKQSDRYALELSLGRLGLPDRDYYLSDNPRFVPIRAQYKAYLAMLLGEAGLADPQGKAEQVYALETDLARAAWDRTVRRNRDLTYHKLATADLGTLPGGADLATLIKASGPGAAAAPYVIATEMPLSADEIAAARLTADDLKAKVGGGIPAVAGLIRSAPVGVWQAWLTARFLSSYAAYLPKRFDEASFALYGKALGGQPQQRARWKRAIDVVEGQVGELLGKVYAERYFPAANRAAMNDLVANLRTAMAANLKDLAWMGPETRVQAQAKLDAFLPKIGAADHWKTYDGLILSATTPLANAMAASAWASAFEDARVGKAVDRTEWFMLPQTVNAYYNPSANEIVFPAAILQPPFFNLTADPAVNYGGIGAVIGHEMGHGFDDQGAKSDGSGNLRDWWTAQDKARFVALTDRLVAQYNQHCPFDAGKTCINGRLTLGENIGDLGGLSLAYRAYHLSLKGKPAPVIDGLTGDQRFFMGFAQVWRSKMREEAARQQLLVDPHSPAKYRVNGIVRNFDEWYKAFNVKPGDALYLPPAERLRIW